MKKIDAINSFLLGTRGYRRIEPDEDPEHFMLGRCERGLSHRIVGGLLTDCSVTFDVKPQRFLKYGELEIEPTSMILRNPTGFPALPIISIEGAGEVTVSSSSDSGNWSLRYKAFPSTASFDAETLNSYSGSISLNAQTVITGEVALTPGDNVFEVTGNVTAIKIIPRWWEL